MSVTAFHDTIVKGMKNERTMNQTTGMKDLRGWPDGFKGDRVIVIIACLLMLVSIISMFSSTSLLALEKRTDRVAIMYSQLKVVAFGALVILGLYVFGGRRLYRLVGRLGFLLSLGMLLVLTFKLDLGFVKAGHINGAWRVIVVFGLQLHVYELVKVLMILYLAWALDTYKEGECRLSGWLASLSPKLVFLDEPFWQKCLYLYVPVAVTLGLVMLGSNSSAIFIATILVLLIVIGGVHLKDIIGLGLGLALVVLLLFGAHKAGILKINRFDTALERITSDEKALLDTLVKYRPGGESYDAEIFNETRDKLQQTVSAKLAIKEGGLFGKGVGNSTQKYVVPVIFGDYMFSFIIEETGGVGAFFIIILYFSLLARGALVAKDCDNYFEKIVVAGLSILVTGQAFMHMMVNVHFPFVPQTGQTLPLVSHGTSSFLVFSTVFGILLSISRQTNSKMQERAAKAMRIIGHEESETTGEEGRYDTENQ